MSNIQEFENQPCKCGSIEYTRVDGNIEEQSGWECAHCGKGFIADDCQHPIDSDSLPQSMRDWLYADSD